MNQADTKTKQPVPNWQGECNNLCRLCDLSKPTAQCTNGDMRRDRPHDMGTLLGRNGARQVEGITFRDVRDCVIRSLLLSTGGRTIDGVNMKPRYDEARKGENAILCEEAMYDFNLDQIDPAALVSHILCEIEKAMGIMNLPK